MSPIRLLKGNEEIKNESIEAFLRRAISDWEIAKENLKLSVELQAKYIIESTGIQISQRDILVDNIDNKCCPVRTI